MCGDDHDHLHEHLTIMFFLRVCVCVCSMIWEHYRPRHLPVQNFAIVAHLIVICLVKITIYFEEDWLTVSYIGRNPSRDEVHSRHYVN